MRVISGKYKGKNIRGFNINGTRPTMDRIKESLFGIIQGKINNSICLDLFAGSGALGIEALSMGAKECYFIDNNIEIISILKENTTGIENVHIINSSYDSFLKKSKQKYDIIFLDPPYDYNLISPALELIIKYDLLNKDGIIICEYIKENINSPFKLIKEKKYGDKHIKIYEK